MGLQRSATEQQGGQRVRASGCEAAPGVDQLPTGLGRVVARGSPIDRNQSNEEGAHTHTARRFTGRGAPACVSASGRKRLQWQRLFMFGGSVYAQHSSLVRAILTLCSSGGILVPMTSVVGAVEAHVCGHRVRAQYSQHKCSTGRCAYTRSVGRSLAGSLRHMRRFCSTIPALVADGHRGRHKPAASKSC